jgi:predicted RNase H-like HicB family nuclease
MKNGMKYPVVIYPSEEGGYVAEVPALKGCLAQGETMLECLEELELVTQLWIASARRHKEKIPSAARLLARLRQITA